MQILGGHYSAYGSTLDYLIWGGRGVTPEPDRGPRRYGLDRKPLAAE